MVSVTTLPAPVHSSSAAAAARIGRRGHPACRRSILPSDRTSFPETPLRSIVLLLLLWAGLSVSGVAHAQAPQHAVPPGMRCPGDKLVWVNTRSGIYHFQGERWFGSTKEGRFLCEHDADKEGDRPTHNGQ
ncbi:MAG: hypothetical protein ACRYG8_16065 [Janthinobacterium lividum]